MTACRLPWKCTLLAVILAGSAWCAVAQEQPATEIKWRRDYNSARKEAQDKGLPLIVDFGTENCFWCKKLDDTTFRDAKVVALLNERFIPLKIDAEREAGLASSLRISSYPTIVIAGPDGKILGTQEGYQPAEKFLDTMQRAVGMATSPEWMQRDLSVAQKCMQAGDFARAISALKTIIEDGKGRSVQASAQKLLADIEQKAAERLLKAKQCQEAGKQADAIEALSDTIRTFPGLPASREATDLLARMVQSPELRNQQRSKRAADLLAQARDYYKNNEYLPCLDRCEILLASYGDLPEGMEGAILVNEIKSNPEWLQNAADTMSDRLGGIYLALADVLLKKGQPQRAEYYLQRVIQAFPGSRQAESAQIRLSQLQATPPRGVEIQSARP